MYIPKSLRHFLNNQSCHTDQLGMSSSHVLICKDYVIKRNLKDIKSHEEKSYNFLKEYVNVPNIMISYRGKIYEYLIMSKINGKMLMDPYYVSHPKEGVKILAKGLLELWSIPLVDCTLNYRLVDKLKVAYQHLMNRNYEIDPDVFKDPRFPKPEMLYEWLVENQPEEDLVFTHGDYCLPNVFYSDQQHIGFIDMDRSGIACKWQDIALCVRSIKYNYEDHQELIDLFFKELGITKNDKLIEYYVLLDEFF